MLKGDFKSVTKNDNIIGFIHRRYDGTYEATAVGAYNRTVSDSLDSEKGAREFIKTTNINRFATKLKAD